MPWGNTGGGGDTWKTLDVTLAAAAVNRGYVASFDRRVDTLIQQISSLETTSTR
jgi:hypothetical protein